MVVPDGVDSRFRITIDVSASGAAHSSVHGPPSGASPFTQGGDFRGELYVDRRGGQDRLQSVAVDIDSTYLGVVGRPQACDRFAPHGELGPRLDLGENRADLVAPLAVGSRPASHCYAA